MLNLPSTSHDNERVKTWLPKLLDSLDKKYSIRVLSKSMKANLRRAPSIAETLFRARPRIVVTIARSL